MIHEQVDVRMNEERRRRRGSFVRPRSAARRSNSGFTVNRPAAARARMGVPRYTTHTRHGIRVNAFDMIF